MATSEEIERIVRDVAGATYPGARISRVISEPGIASSGEDAVRILIVFADRVSPRVIADGFLAALREIWDRLHQLGDDRLAILRFATEDELELHGDPEP